MDSIRNQEAGCAKRVASCANGKEHPCKGINKAAKAPGKLGKRARLAKTLKGFD